MGCSLSRRNRRSTANSERGERGEIFQTRDAGRDIMGSSQSRRESESGEREGQNLEVWYRHSGQPQIDHIPIRLTHFSMDDDRKILEDVGDHHITHISIMHRVIPALMTSSLKQLQLWNVNSSQLDCLRSLTGLDLLDIRDSNFSAGLPPVITEIGTLESLTLWMCQLRELPQRLDCETQLRYLNLSANNLVELPSVVYRMANLKELDLYNNRKLLRINSEICKLQRLTQLYCYECYSLQSPPFGVCIQGVAAVNQFFADLLKGKGVEQLKVPVAVIGMTGAGKSSLIISLQSGKRKLTRREKNSPFDETTKVFQMEDLNDSLLKFIDFGGHDIYQMAYQLVIRERCIPLLVVNMEEFNSYLSAGSREGARRLCIDWLSHLYLASPRLDPPVLVLTHTDKLDSGLVKHCRDKLLFISKAAKRELLRDYKLFYGEFPKESCPIIYLTNPDEPLFNPQEIFEFGNDPDEVSNIKGLRANLEKRCEKLAMKIPLLWERVERFIEREEGTYIPLSKVENEFSYTDAKTILRYMHNTGQILWFEGTQGLSSYIFHKIPTITEMIALLFHHTAEQQWVKRVEEFVPFTYQEEWVSKWKYQAFIAQFTTSGIMDEVLLVDLLKNSSALPVEISMQLLKSFAILNGPIEHNSEKRSYILPYFTTTFVEKAYPLDDNVPLRLDIALGGLSPPPYVYQLMTVAVLKLCSSLLSNIKVWKDGAVIHNEEFTTILNHDLTSRVVSLRVGTTVAQLPASWKHLIETTKAILNQLYAVWKGSHAEVLLYCSQCLIGQNPAPDFYVDPKWFYPIDCNYSITCTKLPATRSHLSKVVCLSCDKLRNDKKPSVPKPLRLPCDQLTDDEIQSLENHISEIRESFLPQTVGHLESTSEEAESDLSDVEGEGYCDESKADKVMRLRLCIVKKPKIKQLYQSNKVYAMSEPVRGRVLIINNMNFRYGHGNRAGSQFDYKNLSRMFKDLKFDIAKSQDELTDLRAQDIYREIQIETAREEHQNLGMFVLVIMTHGTSGNHLLDIEGNMIPFINIQDLLSPWNFPAMKGKPKLVILQACSGERRDFGESTELLPSPISTITSSPTTESTTVSSPSVPQPTTVNSTSAPQSTTINSTSAPLSTTVNSTSAPQSTIVNSVSAPQSTTVSSTSAPQSTTVNSTSAPQSTAVNSTSAPQSTTVNNTSASQLTTVNSTSVPQSTTVNSTSAPLSTTVSSTSAPQSTTVSSTSVPQSPATSVPPPTTLNVDDFFIMKASSESYMATKSCTHGAWFIRVLVATFCKHSSHRDIESLFKIIQSRVRQVSMADQNARSCDTQGGNVPTSICTFTKLRKLYLFPGFRKGKD
ncbi:uncharacterized protein [Watersipora subatra]|uniref:uncharacterized protein n=1 Tax=Watersipora subatra TaxID=2589382 RepID=UPI00355B290E